MVCLIVLAMQAKERIPHLSISYELGLLIARAAGSVASTFIDGVLRRETSNWNRILNDIPF